MRKIIQISADSDEYTGVIALCDDGSLWSLFRREWTRLPGIPQDDVSVPEVNESKA